MVFDVPTSSTPLPYLFFQIKRNALLLNIEGFQISTHSMYRSFTDMTSEESDDIDDEFDKDK